MTYYRITIDVQPREGDNHPDLWDYADIFDLRRDEVRFIDTEEFAGNLNDEEND